MIKEQPYDSILGAVTLTAVVCQMYRNALITFNTIHVDIISGLCQDDSVLTQLWAHVSNARHGPAHALLSLLSADPHCTVPHFAPTALFAEVALSLISYVLFLLMNVHKTTRDFRILDEKELYEDGKPFSIKQIIDIAQFGNIFCFKAIWDKVVGKLLSIRSYGVINHDNYRFRK